MESIDISYWLATRDKKQSRNYACSTPKAQNSSNLQVDFCDRAQRGASKWLGLFLLLMRKVRSRFLRS